MPVQLTTDSVLVVADLGFNAADGLANGRDVDTGVAALEKMPDEHASQTDLRSDQQLDEIGFGH